MNESPRWPVLILCGLAVAAISGSVGYFQRQGADQSTLSTLSVQMKEMENRLSREIDRVDQNSVMRRAEIREEVLQLHGQQQRDLEDLKDSVREYRR